MGFMNFHEYMEKKVKVKTIADFEGDNPKAPQKSHMPKNAGGVGSKEAPKPYKAGSNAKDPNIGKLEDGLAKTGDQKMIYKPAVGADGGNSYSTKSVSGIPSGKKLKTYPATTAEWVDRTKNLSLPEFTKRVRNEALQGIEECECGVSPTDAINQVVSFCKCNANHVRNLVREMKRNNLFESLISELAGHEETFKTLTRLTEAQNIYAQRFAETFLEMVDKPLGMDDMDHDQKSLPSPEHEGDEKEDHEDDDHHDDDHDDHEDHEEGHYDDHEEGHDDDEHEEGHDDDEHEGDDHHDDHDVDVHLKPHDDDSIPKHLKPMMHKW